MKLKSSVEKLVNLCGVRKWWVFLPDELSDHDVVPKTLSGDVFSSTMKIFWLNFLAFFFTKLWIKNDLNNDCTKLCSNQFVLLRLIKFEQNMKSIFPESYHPCSLISTCSLNLNMTPGRKVRRYTKNAKKKSDVFLSFLPIRKLSIPSRNQIF